MLLSRARLGRSSHCTSCHWLVPRATAPRKSFTGVSTRSSKLLQPIKASADDSAGGASGPSGGGGNGGDPSSGSSSGGQQPGAVALVRRFPAAGYTFVLAGFLKILTIGAVATTAPNDAVRTAAGEMSRYLLIPVGLGLCWLAKQITDMGLQENKKFMAGLVAVLVFAYFAIGKILYRYDGSLSDLVRRPRQMSVSQSIARARFPAAGERDLSIARDRESRYVKTDKGLIDLDRYYYGPDGSENEAVASTGGAAGAGVLTEDGEGSVAGRSGGRAGLGSRLYGRDINPRSFLKAND